MWKLKIRKETASRTYHIHVRRALIIKDLYGNEANVLNKPLRKAEKEGSPNLCLGES